MERLAVVVLLGCVAAAGCLGSMGPGATDSPDTVGPGETPTASASTAESGTVSVEYVVRTGDIPDSVAHVYVDFSVYLAERPGDVYSCTDGAPLYDNQYDPTPTLLPTPAGRCERFGVDRVDVAALDGPKSLGPFEASATYAGGHTLVVHDVTVVLENGTTASSVYDTDFRAVTERATPSGTHGVEIGVTDYAGSNRSLRWRFGIDVERFEPAEE